MKTLLFLAAVVAQDGAPGDPAPERVDADAVRGAGAVGALELGPDEVELMLPGVRRNRDSFVRLRDFELENGVAPALRFDPRLAGVDPRIVPVEPAPRRLPTVARPDDLGALVWADIPTLAALVRTREVSCLELVEVYLDRLHAIDAELECVITFLDEPARERARALDRELAAGEWRGLLHGIPWGAKDLLATRGAPTTWGAKPFEHQIIDLDATVVRRLDEAGAVLTAKLTLGALAWGDVWFGGTTRNPWKPSQGSSGSSAGPAAATAAGGVVFAIGSETWGSIVSPSARCGNSSLRPTFGRVSRHGAMALAWSMDKLGPICRSVTDAAIVFDAIAGHDPLDDFSVDLPYADPGPASVEGMRVGFVPGAWSSQEREERILDDLRALGVEPVPVELPTDYPVLDLVFVLNAEAATAFDELTRDGRDDQLVRQVEFAWPNALRVARTIPAVEYLRAARIRRLLMRDVDAVFADVEAIVHPSRDTFVLTATNLTGHPTVCAPSGFREDGTPRSVSFTGRLFGEARLLALAEAWQRSTDHHRRHPEFDLGD